MALTDRYVRMVSTGPQSERGGTIAWTLPPLESRMSTHGDAWSTRRPRGPTIRSIRCKNYSSPQTAVSATSRSGHREGAD
jgi:hypothetical protein